MSGEEEAYTTSAKPPTRGRPIEMLCASLYEQISSLEKSVVSLQEYISPVLRMQEPGGTTSPTDPKFPGGSSTLANQLQECCLRIEAMVTMLDETRHRIEL